MRIPITAKLILFVLVLSLASIYVVGKYSFEKAKTALVERTFDQLTSLRIEKTNRIQNLFLQCENDINNISRSNDNKEIFQIISKSFRTENDSSRIEQIRLVYIQYLKGYLEASKYYSKIIFLSDSSSLFIDIKENGKCSLETAINPILSEINFQTKTTDVVIFTDIEGLGETTEPIIIVALNNERGAILLEVPFKVINDIMLENTAFNGLGESGETYLVGDDFLMRSTSRFENNSVFKTQVQTEGVKDAFAGITGNKEIIDYRGISVLSSFGKVNVPGLNWAILAEIDTREAMVPVISIKNNIIYLTFIIFLLLTGVVSLFTSMITAPIRSLIKSTHKVAEGKFGKTLNYKANDEVGDLVNAFNKMTLQLKVQSENLENERLLRLTSMIDGQELERQRVSKELHDGLGQLILASKLKFERALKKKPEKADQIFKETEELFKITMLELRNISNGLMPAVLTEFGLLIAVRNLAKEVSENSQIEVSVSEFIQPEKLNKKFETYLYRIIQEALNNIIKHSKATESVISMVDKNEKLVLSIKDNGIGITANELQNLKGNGLNNMKDRAALLGGNLEIRGETGNGTEIYLEIINFTDEKD